MRLSASSNPHAPMPSFAQIKDGIFQIVAIFCALLVAYVCISNDRLNEPVMLKEGKNTSLCVAARGYDLSAIKLLFCTRDLTISYITDIGEHADTTAKFNEAVKAVKITTDGRNVSFFDVVDSFARSWHFSDRTSEAVSTTSAGKTVTTLRSKTVHLSPFASVCLQPCKDSCNPVDAPLVFNKFFASVFATCLGIALLLRILAHRCWRFLSTSVMSVRRIAAAAAAAAARDACSGCTALHHHLLHREQKGVHHVGWRVGAGWLQHHGAGWCSSRP